MADINVTVTDNPLQITACVENVIDITVAENGIQGIPGPSGANGVGGSNVVAGVTGISVTGFSSQTGLVNVSGLGTITVFTGENNSIFISGSSVGVSTDHSDGINLSGNLQQTGANLQNQINILTGATGQQINLENYNIVYRTGDQLISGNKTFSGILYADIITGRNSTIGINLANGIINVGGSTSIDFNSKQLFNNSNEESLSWNNHTLKDAVGVLSQNWTNRILYDIISNYSIQYGDRFLRNAAQDYVLDWNNRILSGNWKTNNLFIEGGSTSNLTSAIKFINEGQQHYTIGQSGANFLLANTSDLGNSIWGNSPHPLIFVNEFNNIGIGNTNPIGKFDISGHAYASGGKILTQMDSGNLTSVLNNNLTETGNTLNNKINSLSGYNNDYLVHRINDESITGIKSFVNTLIVENGFVQGLSNTLNNNSSFIQGVSNTADGVYSHAEGAVNTTLGDYSHAEGTSTIASGGYSHAEGFGNIAIGNYSHAEGGNTVSFGIFSHSEGFGTIASGNSQLAIGQYNIPDNNSFFIIGKGIDEENRSNAFLVDQSGNIGINNSAPIGKLDVSGDIYASGGKVLTVLDSGNIISKIFSTGQNLYNNLIGFSGVFNSTGIGIQTQLSNLSSNLQTTGQTLYNQIVGLSGVGNNTITNLQTTGNNLYSYIISLSGVGDNTVSNLQLTGQQAWNTAQNNAVNLSGNITTLTNNLQITGINLGSKIDSLSGFVRNTSVSVTGYTAFTGAIGISGVGSVTVFTGVNNNIIISGAAGGSSFTPSTWSNLTWGATTTWAANNTLYEERKILVMTGNTTLSITNLYNGFAGVLKTVQSGNAISGYSLTIPANTKVQNAGSGIIYLTSGSGAIDFLGFVYDGSQLFASIGNQFT